MTKNEELAKVIAREKRFSTLAKKEGKGAHARALKEKGAAKKDSEWEEGVDNAFVKIRKQKVKTAQARMKK
jgi:hypothetical protein